MPPFPTGQRETRQHRDWIAVYKAHDRLGRRGRGQCERCSAPAADGSIFCDEHRAAVSALAPKHEAPPEDRRALLDAHGGRCRICGKPVQLRDSVDHSPAAGGLRAVLHRHCHRLVGLAEALGPDSLERLRGYLWPAGTAKRPRRR